MYKVTDWLNFSTVVVSHIKNYVIPQYGDRGEDPANGYTVSDCMTQIRRYTLRQGRNARPGQDELDLIKIAHYAQLAWYKLQEAKNEHNI